MKATLLPLALLLLGCGTFWASGDAPADHQRQFVGRMVWPSNGASGDPLVATASFSRQMIIKFPESGKIATPAEGNSPQEFFKFLS